MISIVITFPCFHCVNILSEQYSHKTSVYNVTILSRVNKIHFIDQKCTKNLIFWFYKRALEHSAFLDFSISCNYILVYTSYDVIHYYPPKVLFCSVIHEIELTMLFWLCWQNLVCKSWLDNGTMIWSRVPENTSSRALMTSLSSFGPQKRIKNLLVASYSH